MRYLSAQFLLLATIIVVSLSSFAAPAEKPPEQKIIHSGIEFGGLGGPMFKVNNMGDGFMYSVGGRGAMTVSSIFLFGGGGFGSVGQTSIKIAEHDERVSLGYGGLGVGFKIFPSAIVHISSFNMFSLGHIGLSGRSESSHCYLIEPELNAEFSLISFLRFGLGINYRFIFAKNISLPAKELSGLGGQFYMEFGWL